MNSHLGLYGTILYGITASCPVLDNVREAVPTKWRYERGHTWIYRLVSGKLSSHPPPAALRPLPMPSKRAEAGLLIARGVLRVFGNVMLTIRLSDAKVQLTSRGASIDIHRPNRVEPRCCGTKRARGEQRRWRRNSIEANQRPTRGYASPWCLIRSREEMLQHRLCGWAVRHQLQLVLL